MSRCGDCVYWQTGIKKVFRDKEFFFPFCDDGKGICRAGFMNGQAVPATFGCVDFAAGNDHVVIEEYRDKDPWEVWEWAPCPEHPENNATIDGIEKRYGSCIRCGGTARIRKYGDGWLGDEQLQMHPAEVALRRDVIEAETLARAKAEFERLTGITLPPEALQKEKPANWSGSPVVIGGTDTKLPFE